MKCACGKCQAVLVESLKTGKSRQCKYCATNDMIRAAHAATRTHGMTRTSEYATWVDMRRRCHQPQRPDYKNYGARGIYVCKAWRASFAAFYRDMGPRPKGYVLDRRDNTGPYSPNNCRWVTRKQQERNKRTNRLIEVDGKLMTIVEAAEKLHTPPWKLYKKKPA